MSKVRLGLIARADKTGLGYQTRAYYKHLKPDKTMVVDISGLNGTQQHYDWYRGEYIVRGFPTKENIKYFLEDLDVVLTAETPYNFELYSIAREMGVKTVCVENPEFYDHIKYPEFPMPDLIILPSVWLMDDIQRHAESKGTRVVQIHHPVDRDDFPFRLRTTNKPIHIAGKPAAHDRNGTWFYMQAWPNGTVMTQSSDLAHQIRIRYRHSNVHENINDANFMYQLGDILVLPRRYGGNCLVLNEALSSGMPVIMTDISPNNHLLPQDWLVESYIADSFTPRTRVDIYSPNIQKLHERIEWVRENIESQSKLANEIADSISWDKLKDKYIDVLEGICHQ